MTKEEIKKEFEEDYPKIVEVLVKHFGKGGYTEMMRFFFYRNKQEIESACKRAKIEECKYWRHIAEFSHDITPEQFNDRIDELSSPEVKE